MKYLLTKLERNREFWGLLALVSVFFVLRLPSLIEPYWYGDEGIYQIIGIALRHGRILYSGIWDNKPPLLYLIYAAFNGDQFWVRLFALFIGVATTIAFFFLAKKLFQKPATHLITTALFAFFLATPFLEGNIANAENFMLLPIICAALLVYSLLIKKREQSSLALCVSGLLIGLAFITKIVAVFDFAALLSFAYIVTTQGKPLQKTFFPALLSMVRTYWIFVAGFLIPFVLCCLYFFDAHVFHTFLTAVFSSNVGYVGYGNAFIIPQGLLILKLLLLAAFLIILLVKRNRIAKPTLFILVWLAFSLFNAFFSERPYTHYVLVLLPSIMLFIGWILETNNGYAKLIRTACGVVLVALILHNFQTYSITRVASYYANYLSFVSGHESMTNYRNYFDSGTSGTYDLALFIKTHTTARDSVYVWGNNAQIYVLSDKLPPGRFTVAYHILGSGQNISETARALAVSRPKYIIALNNVSPLPFSITNYQAKFATDNAVIYERLY